MRCSVDNIFARLYPGLQPPDHAIGGPSQLPDLIEFSDGEGEESSVPCRSAAQADNGYAHNQRNNPSRVEDTGAVYPGSPDLNQTRNPMVFTQTSSAHNTQPADIQNLSNPTNHGEPSSSRPTTKKHHRSGKEKMVVSQTPLTRSPESERKAHILTGSSRRSPPMKARSDRCSITPRSARMPSERQFPLPLVTVLPSHRYFATASSSDRTG